MFSYQRIALMNRRNHCLELSQNLWMNSIRLGLWGIRKGFYQNWFDLNLVLRWTWLLRFWHGRCWLWMFNFRFCHEFLLKKPSKDFVSIFSFLILWGRPKLLSLLLQFEDTFNIWILANFQWLGRFGQLIRHNSWCRRLDIFLS